MLDRTQVLISRTLPGIFALWMIAGAGDSRFLYDTRHHGYSFVIQSQLVHSEIGLSDTRDLLVMS